MQIQAETTHDSDQEAVADAQLDYLIDSAQAARGHASLLLLTALASKDERRTWEADGCIDMAQWTAARLGETHYRAARMVAAGHALRHLPRTAAALQSGQLSLDKTVEFTRLATPETEERLLKWARRVSPSTIKAHADEAEAKQKDIAADHREAFVDLYWQDDGRLFLQALLAPDQGAVIAKAISRIAEQIPKLPDDKLTAIGLDDEADAQQRRAGALALIASQALAGDKDTDRATVVVHASLESITGDSDKGGRIAGGPAVHPEIVRKLHCDSRLQFVLTGKEGNPVGIGATSRAIPLWLERVVRERDEYTCTFYGCHHKHWLKTHHIAHAGYGGFTDEDNLVTVCHFHHTLLHEGGWRVALGRGGVTYWFRPDGSQYEPGPALPEELPITPIRLSWADMPTARH